MVDRRLVIAPADGQPAEQHGVVRQAKVRLDRAAISAHVFLRATVEPFAAQQQHDRLQPHADIRPLRFLHELRKMAQQQHRRAERNQVGLHEIGARGLVLALDLQGAVHRRADCLQPRLILRVLARRRPVIFRRIIGLRGQQHVLQRLERRTGQHNGLPRLIVASRGGETGLIEHAFDRGERHRLVKEFAHRTARGNGFGNIHGLSGRFQ